MELEVPVPSQNAFKKRRKEENFSSELTADSLPCDEESFHILAGIISLNVINQVISSYQNPALNQPGLPDLNTLSKIQRLWRQNLSKIGGLPISASVKDQPVINRVPKRLLEECPPISLVQGRRGKPQTNMDNCINQENPNASIMNIDSLGIEKRITLSTTQHTNLNRENIGSDQEHLNPSGNRQLPISNRLGLARTAVKRGRSTKRKIDKSNNELPNRDFSSPSSQFDILPGMTILIQQTSDLSIEDWKRKYCTTVDDNFTLQVEPQRSSSSSSSTSSSSSASLWIFGTVQSVQRLWDSLHKTALPLPSIPSPSDKKFIRQKYSHLLSIRLKDGSIMKVFWPDHEILRFPSMEVQEDAAEVELEDNRHLAIERGGGSKPAEPTAMEVQLLQEMFSDSDASDDHSHNSDQSGSDSDDSASSSGFMELLQQQQQQQHSSPATELPCTASNVQEDEFYTNSLQTIGGTDNIAHIPTKQYRSILSFNNAEDVLLSTAGQRVTKRQVDEIDERFERWKSRKNMPIFKILPHDDPNHSVEHAIDDDSDLEDVENSSPAPDVIIIGETEKLIKKNYNWIAKLENVYIRFCQPTAYEVVIPSLKCSMNASAFEKGDSLLTSKTFYTLFHYSTIEQREEEEQMLRQVLLKGYVRPSDTLRRFSKKKAVPAVENIDCINMSVLYEKEARVGNDAVYKFGKLGHLSAASVLFQVGNTVVHAAVNSEHPDKDSPSDSFLPLTVDYRFRGYAIGLIPDVPARRERRNGEDEILAARCIDRAVRPLFPKGYCNNVQIMTTTHAADGIHDSITASVNAASLALMLSKEPWHGPIGCCRVGLVDGKLKVNPTLEELNSSSNTMNLLYAGTKSRTLMLECSGKEIPDDVMKNAMSLAHTAIQPIIEAQEKAVANISTQNEIKNSYFKVSKQLYSIIHELGWQSALEVYSNTSDVKATRGRAEGKLRSKLSDDLASHPIASLELSICRSMAIDKLMNSAFRAVTIGLTGESEPVRVDGRSASQLRPISCAAAVMPMVHGSAYFARGDTHVLCTTTLGSRENSLKYIPVDGTRTELQKYFMLHYDFPPYCTGEVDTSAGGTNRRMIGHGNLAERALAPLMPELKEFPYTVRMFAECTSSNGSSSMASVCAASLALWDAGVPLPNLVAGLSIGLVSKADSSVGNIEKFVILKDILGSEDHNGDMDFKIAGTVSGITAIQLDVKLEGGVPLDILAKALDVAKEGRLEILNIMGSSVDKLEDKYTSADKTRKGADGKVLSLPGRKLKSFAPRAEVVQSDEERRSKLIGKGGEMIKLIQEMFQCEIDIDETGLIYIFGIDSKSVRAATNLVRDVAITVKEGDIVVGEVIDIRDYGLMVKINRVQEALLHVSELSHDTVMMKKPLKELITAGTLLQFKVFSVEKSTGIVKVSRKQLLDTTTSVPDDLAVVKYDRASYEENDDDVESEDSSESYPFPVTPPRAYSKDYFRNNIATDTEIRRAMSEEMKKRK